VSVIIAICTVVHLKTFTQVLPDDAKQHRNMVSELTAVADKKIGFASRTNKARNVTQYVYTSKK
jgi:hypothetical protein